MFRVSSIQLLYYTHHSKLTSVFYIPVYFGDGYIDLVGRLAEDNMNDAVEEVKASPDTVGASGEVRNYFFRMWK